MSNPGKVEWETALAAYNDRERIVEAIISDIEAFCRTGACMRFLMDSACRMANQDGIDPRHAFMIVYTETHTMGHA